MERLSWVLAAVIFAGALLYLTGEVTAAAVGGESAAPPLASATPLPEGGKGTPGEEVDVLDAKGLFGLWSPPVQSSRPVAPEVPKSALSLKLKGVLSGDARAPSMAIISGVGGEESAYRVGEALPGGAELHEVYADRVIILRGGRRESLMLETGDDDGGTVPARRAGLSPSAGGGDVAAR